MKEAMINDTWIEEIATAINEMVDTNEIKKLIREKLELAYEAGYANGAEEATE